MKIAVVGLGRIGLQLVVQLARSGHRTFGADLDSAVVGQVNARMEPFPGEQHPEECPAEAVRAKCLTATIDTAAAVTDRTSS